MTSSTDIKISDEADFAELRQNGGIYVDKTEFLYRLLTWKLKKRFFVSRPRRFGKSLMISTLKCILQGQKELFKGTYICDKSDYDWPTVKVLHFDMSLIPMREPEKFSQNMTGYIKSVLEESGYGAYDPTIDISLNFRNALRAFASHKSGPVAVLIDEYDAPIGHCLGDIVLAEKVRDALHDIYIVLKSESGNIRFLMLTGVSKFSQLSIFSGLNNLTDLYEDRSFATMFGYTEQELDDNFGELMKAHAKVMGLTDEDYRAELKRWYNGYCFKESTETVYNPMAIAKTLSFMEPTFQATWSAGSRSSMLVNFIARGVKTGIDFDKEIRVKPDQLGNVAQLDKLKLVDILYQAGYLTIDRYEKSANRLVLRVPDGEISQDLNSILLEMRDDGTMHDTAGLRAALVDGKVNLFVAELKPFYASLVYGTAENIVYEAVYRRDLMIALRAEGFRCVPEAEQANGNRADLVVTYGKCVYVLELKRGNQATAEDALQQIIDRDYVAPYAKPGYTLFQVGLAFDDKTHHLVDTKVQKLTVPVPED